jgi:hypothetical protein
MSAAAVVPLSLIVFRGAGLLDAAIEVESWITHCGVCDGAGYLYESTIQTAEDGRMKDGWQSTRIAWKSSQYTAKGEGCWILTPTTDWQAKIDVKGALAFAQRLLGHVSYSKEELVEDAIAYLTHGLADQFPPRKLQADCADAASRIYLASGVPDKIDGKATYAWGTTPMQLVQWRGFWAACVQVAGEPTMIPGLVLA